ncbi:MAG: glycosyltransferase [Hyphomonadaceae bacterium]|nr:glycosyltransferase [Hyphomonadaceae bacterium]
MQPIGVTVVIVTFNSRAHFPRLRAALEGQTIPYALIVLDNASDADQRPTAADFPAHAQFLQQDRNLGFAEGNNKAAALVETPLMALLNPDAFPEPDWLAELAAAAARHPEAAAFGSTQISAAEPGRYDGLGDRYGAYGFPWRAAHGALRTFPAIDGEAFSPCAAAALYRIAAWRAAGGFEPSYFCFVEDVDLGFRLRLMGWTCRQAASAVVAHIGGASAARRSAFAVYHGRRNRIWTLLRCMPWPLLVLAAPLHVAHTLLQVALSVGGPHFRPTMAALRDALRGSPAALQARRQIQASRTASLGAIAAAFTWSPLTMARRR